MQAQPAATPAQTQAESVWYAVEVAAAGVPDWVLTEPKQAQQLSVQVEGKIILIAAPLND